LTCIDIYRELLPSAAPHHFESTDWKWAYALAMAGRNKSRRSVALPAICEDVRRIAAAHGAGNVRVFGSVGRGEEGASSDLDLLVDMAEGRSLFDLIALSNDLEESLGVDVDVVTEASLSPYIRDRVLEEAVAL
jgi:predicted nucleotidyltransferase